jgi:hypothetical protein
MDFSEPMLRRFRPPRPRIDRSRSTRAGGLVFFVSTSWAQGPGICVTAKVPEAFTLPDGTVHAAGRLVLCSFKTLNPVVGLHRVWTDGEGASLVRIRRARAAENAESRPVLLFQRASGTLLDLVGYVLPDGGKSWSYALERSERIAVAGPEVFGATQPATEQ